MRPRERAVVCSVASTRRRRRGRGPVIDPVVLAALVRLRDEMESREREGKPAPTFDWRGREGNERGGPDFWAS